MIDPAFARTMAAYNAWQNESLVGAATALDEAARILDRGAFFGSIQGTLSHVLWGDRMWLSRFAGLLKPTVRIQDSARYIADWGELVTERKACDAVIADWAAGISQDWLSADIVWFSGATQREMRKPAWLLVTHMFNHQTHHRGQVHAMLTAAGARPDDTDLMMIDPSG